jgi:uncharacterized C2H2 Zn-finger protein
MLTPQQYLPGMHTPHMPQRVDQHHQQSESIPPNMAYTSTPALDQMSTYPYNQTPARPNYTSIDARQEISQSGYNRPTQHRQRYEAQPQYDTNAHAISTPEQSHYTSVFRHAPRSYHRLLPRPPSDPERDTASTATRYRSNEFRCSRCGRMFRYEKALNKHENECDLIKYRCRYCGGKYGQRTKAVDCESSHWHR